MAVQLTRRAFFAAAALAASSASAAGRGFTIAFTPGSIGIKAGQDRAIDLAHGYGFESVQPFGADLEKLSKSQLDDLVAGLKGKSLQWAAASSPVNFREDDQTFNEGVKTLRRHAKVLEQAKVTRMGTWVPPSNDELTYNQNLRRTAKRLREMAAICGDHGMRLGLEYIGTDTLLLRGRYPFIHTMAETKELIAATGMTNIGFVMDSWHWWTAGDSVDDILSLTNVDVVSCDVNDAPTGRTMIEQMDNQRELPAATGVIPIKDFLDALVKIGYDGPVRAEPFNKTLNEMNDEEASAKTVESIKKAFALIG